MASDGVYTATPLELVLGTFENTLSNIQDVNSSAASVGTGNSIARGNHTHYIALATGTSNGQIKIAGKDISVKGWASFLPTGGGTMTGALSLSGVDIMLKTTGSSSDDSGDIVWYYGNGQEKMRIWTANTYTAKTGPNYRVYNSSGTSLYSGVLVCGDGSGASGTWGISISGSSASCTGNAATATSATKATGDKNGADITTTYLKLSGGTMTGAITFARTATGNFIQVNQNGTNSGYWRIGTLGPANTEGWTDLVLGNSVASTAANNASGRLYLYNSAGANSNIRGTRSTIAGTARDAITAGYFVTTQVTGALWNDYAECRKCETVKPGLCVYETDNIMKITNKRLIPGAKIVSDTFGMLIGETENCHTPIAVSGRVLAYPYKKRKLSKFKLGKAVCSAPDGTVDIMTRLECILFPDRIIGIVSEIPAYDIWIAGAKDDPQEIKVNNRIWIYVR